MTVSLQNLFEPITTGQMELKHRAVMAPLTRFRADDKHVQREAAATYYGQRSQREGTLIITEATFITERAGGYPNIPGIWNQKQIDAWKMVFDKIHAQKSFVYLQLWALGRAADLKFIESEGNDYVGASDVQNSEAGKAPRALTRDEIKQYVQDYVTAAKNAIAAGADGVEIHNANGYLLDQFLHENTNKRTDEYGGSIENRARFTLEIVDAVSEAISAKRVGIRLSPWGKVGEMEFGTSPIPQFSYLVTELERRGVENHRNRLAYIHAIEPRIAGNKKAEPWATVPQFSYVDDAGESTENSKKKLASIHTLDPQLVDERNYRNSESWTGSNRFVRDIWTGVWIRAGAFGHDYERLSEVLEEDDNTMIAFGRYFISNPDLVNRLEKGIELNKYNRTTFYGQGPEGYTDYPFADSK